MQIILFGDTKQMLSQFTRIAKCSSKYSSCCMGDSENITPAYGGSSVVIVWSYW